MGKRKYNEEDDNTNQPDTKRIRVEEDDTDWTQLASYIEPIDYAENNNSDTAISTQPPQIGRAHV